MEKRCENCKFEVLKSDVYPCNECNEHRNQWEFDGMGAIEGIKTGPCKPVGKFENIGRALGELVDDKQQAYGDAITAVEQMMKVLYPEGVKIEQYRDMLLMVRIMDKQCRIAKGDKKAFGESPFMDIGGYSLLGVGHECL